MKSMKRMLLKERRRPHRRHCETIVTAVSASASPAKKTTPAAGGRAARRLQSATSSAAMMRRPASTTPRVRDRRRHPRRPAHTAPPRQHRGTTVAAKRTGSGAIARAHSGVHFRWRKDSIAGAALPVLHCRRLQMRFAGWQLPRARTSAIALASGSTAPPAALRPVGRGRLFVDAPIEPENPVSLSAPFPKNNPPNPASP